MAGSDSIAQVVASGSQDIAALAGLFCTDAVERNALALHLGNGNLAISPLSLLGVVGLVKSALKICLGRERCRAAGYNLDSIRGLFGYTALEKDGNKSIVDCDIITVKFGLLDITVRKEKSYLHAEYTPIVTVGSRWAIGGGALTGCTALGLGNMDNELSWTQNPWLYAFLGTTCAGFTSWLLVVVDVPWTWVRLFAMIGMHLGLTALFAVPLYVSSQTRRPGLHLTSEKIKALMLGEETRIKSMHLMQCRVGNGDVLHAQGDTSFMHRWPLRIFMIMISIVLVVAYLCQFAIVSLATNKSAIIWITCQAVAALLRSAYWICALKFGDTQPEASDMAVISNSALSHLTLAELVCASRVGETVIPRWVWTYLRTTTLEDIIRQAANRDVSDIIPIDAEWMAFTDEDFNRVFRNRVQGILPNHTHHGLFMAFWREKQNPTTVHPFFLVGSGYLRRGDSTNCYIEAFPFKTSVARMQHPCTLFAIDYFTYTRIHLRPHTDPITCTGACAWQEASPTDSAKQDTWRFVLDRCRMCDELSQLVDQHTFSAPIGRQRTAVEISGGASFTDRKGGWSTLDLREGLDRLVRCVEGEYRQLFRRRAWWRGLLGEALPPKEKRGFHQA